MDAKDGYEGGTMPERECFDVKKDLAEMTSAYGDPSRKKDVKVLKTRALQLKNQYVDTDDQCSEMAEAVRQYR